MNVHLARSNGGSLEIIEIDPDYPDEIRCFGWDIHEKREQYAWISEPINLKDIEKMLNDKAKYHNDIGECVYSKQEPTDVPDMEVLYNTEREYYVSVNGNYIKCEINWYQGRGNNYRFNQDGFDDIFPIDVDHVYEIVK